MPSDLIEVCVSEGTYAWVTPREHEVLRSHSRRERRGRRLRPPDAAALVTALALVLALASLFLALRQRPPAYPVASEAPWSPPEPVPAVATLVDATEPAASSAGDIETTVQAWAFAWARQDVDDYLSFYSDRFRVPDGLRRESWESIRHERIRRPAFVEVKVSDLETFPGSAGTASVRFVQSYRAPGYSDRVRKTLELVHEHGRWQIFAERSTPLTQPGRDS